MGSTARFDFPKVFEKLNDHLRFLENRLNIGICRVDLSERRMVWSDGIYDLFDHDRSVQPSRDALLQRMHPADRKDREVVNVALQRRISFDDRFRVILRDRRIRWMRASGEFLFDENGTPDALLVLMTDVTAEQTQRDVMIAADAARRPGHAAVMDTGHQASDMLTGVASLIAQRLLFI
ncbi:hypothetical protein CQ12_24445 [Bradyrhizobium jicamae]|uniref:PAC domain-containing protein n=1 Tax=Bradyrhizobium jicamae TaxID=280332 RepID=A0A0R3KWR8_9BRAD|nr:PAS domain-containing protein [Bradyrhizobium jicamae]KRQ99920.1 hypothetical protein CQ12_24445 [Bradyrhizobium jicamae]